MICDHKHHITGNKFSIIHPQAAVTKYLNSSPYILPTKFTLKKPNSTATKKPTSLDSLTILIQMHIPSSTHQQNLSSNIPITVAADYQYSFQISSSNDFVYSSLAALTRIPSKSSICVSSLSELPIFE